MAHDNGSHRRRGGVGSSAKSGEGRWVLVLETGQTGAMEDEGVVGVLGSGGKLTEEKSGEEGPQRLLQPKGEKRKGGVVRLGRGAWGLRPGVAATSGAADVMHVRRAAAS
jgi:hypothetical protein